jgi:hypothetical protein
MAQMDGRQLSVGLGSIIFGVMLGGVTVPLIRILQKGAPISEGESLMASTIGFGIGLILNPLVIIALPARWRYRVVASEGVLVGLLIVAGIAGSIFN